MDAKNPSTSLSLQYSTLQMQHEQLQRDLEAQLQEYDHLFTAYTELQSTTTGQLNQVAELHADMAARHRPRATASVSTATSPSMLPGATRSTTVFSPSAAQGNSTRRAAPASPQGKTPQGKTGSAATSTTATNAALRGIRSPQTPPARRLPLTEATPTHVGTVKIQHLSLLFEGIYNITFGICSCLRACLSSQKPLIRYHTLLVHPPGAPLQYHRHTTMR
jgi:hypothetical protein